MYVVWSTMKFPTGPCIRLLSSYWYKKPRPSTCSFQPHVLHDHNLLGLCSHHDLHGHHSLLSEKRPWVRRAWAFRSRGFKRDPQNLRGSISQVGRSIHPKRCKWIATYLVCNPLRKPIVRCSLCACICFTSVINGIMALISSYTCLPSAKVSVTNLTLLNTGKFLIEMRDHTFFSLLETTKSKEEEAREERKGGKAPHWRCWKDD